MATALGVRVGRVQTLNSRVPDAKIRPYLPMAWFPPWDPRKGEPWPKFFWAPRGPEKEDVNFALL